MLWIRILVLADQDPDPMDRAQNFELFTFLKFENLSSGSKVISLQSWVLFVKKSIFLANSLPKNQGSIGKYYKFAKNYNFWAKIWIQ